MEIPSISSVPRMVEDIFKGFPARHSTIVHALTSMNYTPSAIQGTYLIFEGMRMHFLSLTASKMLISPKCLPLNDDLCPHLLFASGCCLWPHNCKLGNPQGISYAKLANLPPVIGLYSSFVPPLIYSVLGSSGDLAVGPISIASLVMGSMLKEVISPEKEPILYIQLAFTATFFTGVFQASLGLLRKQVRTSSTT